MSYYFLKHTKLIHDEVLISYPGGEDRPVSKLKREDTGISIMRINESFDVRAQLTCHAGEPN